MTVTCPSCRTKYSVNDSLVKSAEQKMRCSKCGEIFVLKAPVEMEPGLDRVVEQIDAQPSFAEIAAQVGLEDIEKEAPTEKETKEPQSRTPLRTIIVVLILLFLLCVGGYLYWTNYMGAGDRWLRVGKLEGQEVVTQDGRVFLVTGVVSNGSTKTRKSIVLRVKLFDGQGKVISEKDSLAGMLLSRRQIPSLLKNDVEKRVAAFKLSPPETFRVESGKEIPFSISFLNDDFSKAKEFTVQIIQSSYL